MNKWQSILFSVLIIPMDPAKWLDLKYSKLKKNDVKFSKELSISVDQSASPLFYVFDKSKSISNIEVEGSINIDEEIKENIDDRYFQIGLIYEGDYKPNSFVKIFLPEWMKTLIKVGKGKGLGSVHFYGIGGDKKVKQKVRDLKLIFENVVSINKDGSFKFSKTLSKKDKVLGLWLRSDGDESKAKFQTIIKSIKLESN